MSKIFLNLIQNLNPELAHFLTIKLLKFYSKKKNLNDNPILNQRFLGLDFSNPIGLAAGFDKNAEVINPMLNFGFGFVEVGTITPKYQIGNIKPRIFRLKEDHAIINHLGFNNQGSEKILDRLKKINLSNLNQGIVGINIGKNKSSENAINDYCYCLDMLGKFGHYITINISSPNTPGLRDLQLRGRIEVLVKALQKKQSENPNIKQKPIFLKISPDLNDQQLRDIALMSLANNVSGLIIGNTTIDRPINLMSNNKNEIGGLSGKPLFIKSTLSLKKMFSLTNGQIPLIGVGGILSKKDFDRKINAGASLVQVYTGFIVKGPSLINEILTS